MSLRVVVAAPFKQAGDDRLRTNEFVVALSLDRDWMSPDQAKRLVDIAAGEGLLERDDGALVATFDVGAVSVPEGFSPDASLFEERSVFERILERLEADGVDKQTAVAEVNQLQEELAVTVEAAAVLFAKKRGVDVGEVAAVAERQLRQ